jgi:ParB family chromosome partitioning protein
MASIKERQANKAALINLDDDEPQQQAAVRSEPRTAPGQLMNLQGKYAQVLDENKQLQERLQASVPSELTLDDLYEKAGRRRKLTDDQFTELVSNLRTNPLVTPVTVRSRPAGGYEIVSGHNRVQAFRELGRDRILAVVIEADDDQAELNAFYANLLQSDLPDFEKYLGFCHIEERHPTLTRVEIAANAGVSKSTITQLMSFSNLPAETIDILRTHPHLVGANAAQDLAKLSGQGRAVQVTDAVRRLAAGEFDQTRAVRFARLDAAVKPKVKVFEPLRIRSGKNTFCDVRQADKVLRLVFSSAEDATVTQAAIRAVLQALADEKKEK